MKIALLGDTHFGIRGDDLCFHNMFRKFYENIFFPYLESNNIKNIIQLGDVFDRRKYINYLSLFYSKEYFFEKINKDYTTYMLVGNHDTFYKNTNNVNSPTLLLEQYKNIHTINQPTEIQFDDISFLFVPWICSENAITITNAIQNTKSQLLVGHFEIKGFEMHKGVYSEDGFDINWFDKFDRVISGHYHTRSHRNNITYIGTPYQLSWGEYDEDKGFGIFDTDTREITFINNPYKIFHKVWYNDKLNSDIEILNKDYSIYRDVIIKVIISEKNNLTLFEKFIEKIENNNPAELQVVEDHMNMNIDNDDLVNEVQDTLTILDKYIDQLNLNIDKRKLNNLLRSLYDEALTME